MYGSSRWIPQDRVEDLKGASAEISADAPSVSVRISKRIKIGYQRCSVEEEKQMTLCGGIKTDN